MTLLELTGHEAGIIVYKDDSVLVTNWNQCNDDCIPALAPVGGIGRANELIWFPHEQGYIENAKESRFDDIRTILKGKTVLLDEFNDISRLMSDEPDEYGMIPELSGTKYTFNDGKAVYVFRDWN